MRWYPGLEKFSVISVKKTASANKEENFTLAEKEANNKKWKNYENKNYNIKIILNLKKINTKKPHFILK